MNKITVLMLIVVMIIISLIMIVPARANKLGDFLKGENSDYPLNLAPYVAWNFDAESGLVPDRVKLEYLFNAGQLDNGATTLGFGYEWGPGAK